MKLPKQLLKKLSPRHEKAALLRATGLSWVQVAEQTGYSYQNVAQFFAHDPLFLAKVEEYKLQIHGAQVEEAQQWIQREVMPTLEKVKQHRDGNDARTSLTACTMILDRGMPAVKRTEEDRTIKIILSREEVRRINQAEEEMKIVEGQCHEIPPAP